MSEEFESTVVIAPDRLRLEPDSQTTDNTSMELQQELHDLTAELQSSASPIGDWKVAKYNEYLLAGLPAPYDIAELHAKRQKVRDRINEIREIISAKI